MVLQHYCFLITKNLILVIKFFAAHNVTIFWAGLNDDAIAPFYRPAYPMAHFLKNGKIFQMGSFEHTHIYVDIVKWPSLFYPSNTPYHTINGQNIKK